MLILTALNCNKQFATNPAITLLFELCNSRLLSVPNNPCDSIGMLYVDEGIVLVDNRSKTLQTQSVL